MQEWGKNGGLVCSLVPCAVRMQVNCSHVVRRHPRPAVAPGTAPVGRLHLHTTVSNHKSQRIKFSECSHLLDFFCLHVFPADVCCCSCTSYHLILLHHALVSSTLFRIRTLSDCLPCQRSPFTAHR